MTASGTTVEEQDPVGAMAAEVISEAVMRAVDTSECAYAYVPVPEIEEGRRCMTILVDMDDTFEQLLKAWVDRQRAGFCGCHESHME